MPRLMILIIRMRLKNSRRVFAQTRLDQPSARPSFAPEMNPHARGVQRRH
jgi:hypothetical protein